MIVFPKDEYDQPSVWEARKFLCFVVFHHTDTYLYLLSLALALSIHNKLNFDDALPRSGVVVMGLAPVFGSEIPLTTHTDSLFP